MIRQRRLTLACSVIGAAVVALDGTVLTLAQPALQRDLDAGFAQVQWTSTGYLIAVASLLVFAGRLGDRYGHRKIFALGTLGFAAASAGIALAPGIGWVIALRVLQGVCGALLQPATLGMLRAAYPPGRLAMPIALRTSAIGLAAAAGPLVGGALVSAYGWRSVFALTVLPALAIGLLALAVPVSSPPTASPVRLPGAPPASAASVELYSPAASPVRLPGAPPAPAASVELYSPAASPVRLPAAPPASAASVELYSPAASPVRLPAAPPASAASAEPCSPTPPPTSAPGYRGEQEKTRASLDLPGAFLLAVTLACLVHVLVAVPEIGSTAGTAGTGLALAAALVAGALLVRHERRAAHPLLPPALLRSGPVAAGLGALLASSAALFGSLFVATYFLQDVRGLDPLTSAVWTLPLAVVMVLGAPAAALAQRRFGPRRTTVAGGLLLTLGVLLLSRLDERATAVTTGGCFVLLGAGFSTVMVTATAAVVKRAAAAEAGVAGGLQQTAMNTGPALGVATATLLMTLDPSAGFVPAMGPTLLALAAVAALGAAAALGLPGGSAEPQPRGAERPRPALHP